ncbi:hypothetical protein AB433_03340 [Croceicoccus naphthovorans]|uniref:Serine acetyltransferase n=1 Tax=Croceicoccus naphthovorans TaxID=1348774 RepID=A0A0G3XM23_9SPHN|nr:hypothetical protein AB433_03340 [Croceicoccus naphthovorans]
MGKHPGWGFWLRHLALMPGFNFVLGHRLVRAVCKVPIIGRPMARIGLFMLEMSYSSEVAISAKIGGGFYVPHPFGIVIGSDIAIGRNVMILQNVTLGRRASGDTRTPTIGDGVTIGAGAVVVGPIAIGNNATVAANALVLDDVPKGGRAIGNPARILPPKD